MEKTEVIPIDIPEYCQMVIQERITKLGGTRIPDNIHIVEDSISIRILGTWFGNNTDMSASWANVLEKIDRSLAV